MDSRATVFIEVMIGVAIVGLLSFLVVLVARYRQPAKSATADGRETHATPPWYASLLAIILLIAVVVVVIWQIAPLAGQGAGAWRSDPRSLTFFIVMLAVAGVGLIAFVIALMMRVRRAPEVAATAERSAPEQAQPATPAAARLMGLVLLAVFFLLLNWIYVPRGIQYSMLLQLIYPAAFAVALVMLFDKATRAWNVKGTAASLREWLLCDCIVFLLILGFLNLLESRAEAKYASMIWDLLHVFLFFLVLWMLDRKTTRLRFLVAYGYLIFLPILLLIWQATQGVVAPKDQSWWSTIWPFFGVAIIFFVLEIISLIATRDSNKQVVPAIKDAVFLVIYGILLIGAVPATGG